MRRPTVDIYWGAREERLVEGGPRPVVPEGAVGIRVSSPRRTLVLFDDEPLSAVWSAAGDTAYAQVDLTNRVGFHRVAVRLGAETIGFDFETSTAKATWGRACHTRWPTPRRSSRALVRVVVEARRMLPSGVAGFGRRRLDRRPLDGVGVELAAEQGAGASDAGVGRAAGQKTAVEPLAGWDDVHAVL
ncbi:MAG: hypothetical protein KDA21_15805 [Phycisphaerales bacterium]|nr:hypothetical protein [Phycisphaerales bacterium]